LDSQIFREKPEAMGLVPPDTSSPLDDNEFTPSPMEQFWRVQMNINLDQALVEVSPNTFLQIKRAEGVTLSCVSGSLWITRDNSMKDFQLAPGESYIADDGQPLTVCGFESSIVRVFQPSMNDRSSQAKTAMQKILAASLLPSAASAARKIFFPLNA
jgi:hypothetical protein